MPLVSYAVHANDADLRSDRRVTTAALRAAVAWTRRDSEAYAWRELSRMTGVVSHVLGPGRGPAGPLDLVRFLQAPLSELLPGADVPDALGNLVLLDRSGELTDGAVEVGCEYTEALFEAVDDPAQQWLPSWAWQRAEQVQRAVFDRLISSGNTQHYTVSRRFLIEHPAGDERELVELRNAAGALPVAHYDQIPPDRVYGNHGGTWWWPCPVCRWPMRINGESVECGYSHHDARFRLDVTEADRTTSPRLVKVSPARLRTPQARDADGARCVDLAVWRFVTVPGVPELELERRLLRIGGVDVRMWPDLDRVDLVARTKSGRQWEIDVKDHADVNTIVNNAPAARDVVVPDYRRAQVRPLARALPDKRVWTVSSFVRHVRKQTGEASA